MEVRITGTGSYIPERKVQNEAFANGTYYLEDGSLLDKPGEEIITKFEEITGIRERRYVKDGETASTIGYYAGKQALEDAQIDGEELDGIFLAHNFGDVLPGNRQPDVLPALASRVKQQLGIRNPHCIAFDLLYGCPGWIQSLITAHHYLKAGDGKRYLVIGTETLSRNLDLFDRDAMIFSDGAGASLVEATPGSTGRGIISTVSQTFTHEEAYFLHYGKSYNPEVKENTRYIKMKGRKIFEFGLNHVPGAMKAALDKAGAHIDEVKKVLIHQANEKMDEAIIKRFYRLYRQPVPEHIMPMSIHELGNSSVATVPTLLDRLLRGKLGADHSARQGDLLLLASVGSGMSINAVVYRL
jgi:3-oxoacyl-[acyl-carrier-protein] synthase-3